MIVLPVPLLAADQPQRRTDQWSCKIYICSMCNMCKFEFFRVTQRKHHTFLYVIFLQMQCLIKCGYIGAFWKGRIKMILLFLGCSKKYIFCILKTSPYLELANFGRFRWKRLCSQKELVYSEIPSLTATSYNYQEQDCQNFWPRKSTLSKLYFESYCWQNKISYLYDASCFADRDISSPQGGVTWCGKYSVCFAFVTFHIVWMVVPISS